MLRQDFHAALRTIQSNACSDIAEEDSITNNSSSLGASALMSLKQEKYLSVMKTTASLCSDNDEPATKSVASQTRNESSDALLCPTCQERSATENAGCPRCGCPIQPRVGDQALNDDADSGTGSVVDVMDTDSSHKVTVTIENSRNPHDFGFSRVTEGLDKPFTALRKGCSISLNDINGLLKAGILQPRKMLEVWQPIKNEYAQVIIHNNQST